MNDAELDALAKRAAVHTRAEARAVADSEAALARLLADAASDVPEPLAPVIPYHGPIRDPERRPRWQLAAVAAVLAVFAVGIGYALVNGSGTIEVAGPPAAGSGAGTGPTISATAPPSSLPSSPASSVPDTPQSAPTTAGAPVSSAPAATSPTSPATTEPVTSMAITVPDFGPGDPSDLPRLLLRPATPSSVTYTRVVRSADAVDPTLTQVWVQLGDGQRIASYVVVHTRASSTPLSGTFLGAEPIEVPGWDAVRTSPPGAASFTAELVTGGLVVDVLVSGLDEAAALAILRDIRPGDQRYTVPTVDDIWIELPSAWSAGVARRELIVLDEVEGDVAWSIDVATGDDLLGSGLFVADAVLELTEAGGHPALLQRTPIPQLIVLRDDGLMIRVGARNPGDDVVAAAEALIEVDETIFAESTTPRPDEWGDCVSLFC